MVDTTADDEEPLAKQLFLGLMGYLMNIRHFMGPDDLYWRNVETQLI